MKKAKSLHPVPKPKPKPKAKHKGPRHPQAAAPPHSTGSASHLGPITPPPAHHAKPGKPHHAARPKRPKRKQPARKLASPGRLVACCSAEAVAMSLRLAGGSVTDEDVLALYFATAAGPDEGASITATLEAAAGFGLAGVRLAIAAGHVLACDNAERPPGQLLALVPEPVAEPVAPGDMHGRPGVGDDTAVHQHLVRDRHIGADLVDVDLHGLILGLDLPEGPHAVLATSAGWWSWGELYPPSAFSGAVIGEAWAVTW